jgi:dodecin
MSAVYKVIEVIGSSDKSWEDAAKVAVERASKTLDDLRIAEVISQDIKIENGKISAYRTKLSLSFKFKE